MSVSTALQQAIYTALQGLYPVYDDVTTPITMPYILLGETTMRRNDPKQEKIHEFVFDLHAFSNYQGSKEVKEMNDYIVSKVVDTALVVPGYTVIRQQLELSEFMRELDANRVTLSDNAVVYHGIVQVRIHLWSN